jgi:hypothetical protein
MQSGAGIIDTPLIDLSKLDELTRILDARMQLAGSPLSFGEVFGSRSLVLIGEFASTAGGNLKVVLQTIQGALANFFRPEADGLRFGRASFEKALEDTWRDAFR